MFHKPIIAIISMLVGETVLISASCIASAAPYIDELSCLRQEGIVVDILIVTPNFCILIGVLGIVYFFIVIVVCAVVVAATAVVYFIAVVGECGFLSLSLTYYGW